MGGSEEKDAGQGGRGERWKEKKKILKKKLAHIFSTRTPTHTHARPPPTLHPSTSTQAHAAILAKNRFLHFLLCTEQLHVEREQHTAKETTVCRGHRLFRFGGEE